MDGLSKSVVSLQHDHRDPDTGFGVWAGTWLDNQWLVLGTVSDANSVVTDVDFFSDGAESSPRSR